MEAKQISFYNTTGVSRMDGLCLGGEGWGYAIPKSPLSQPVRITTQVQGAAAALCPSTGFVLKCAKLICAKLTFLIHLVTQCFCVTSPKSFKKKKINK